MASPRQATPFVIRMSDDLYRRMAEHSEATKRTMTVEIGLALDRFLAAPQLLDDVTALKGSTTFGCRLERPVRDRLRETAEDLDVAMNLLVLCAMERWLTAAPEAVDAAVVRSPSSRQIEISAELYDRVAAASPKQTVGAAITSLLEAAYPPQNDPVQDLQQMIEAANLIKQKMPENDRRLLDALITTCLMDLSANTTVSLRSLDNLRTAITRHAGTGPASMAARKISR